MTVTNKLISTAVAFCFILNTACSDLALAQSTSSYNLATSSIFDDLGGLEKQDMGRIEAILRLDFAAARAGDSLDIGRLIAIADRYHDQKFKTQIFFREPKDLPNGYTAVLCKTHENDLLLGTGRYYAVFSKEARDYTHPVYVYTEKEFNRFMASGDFAKTPPKRGADRSTAQSKADAKAIEKYVKHEMGIDQLIKYAHDRDTWKLGFRAISSDTIGVNYSKIVAEILSLTKVIVDNPGNLKPLRARECHIIPITKAVEAQLKECGVELESVNGEKRTVIPYYHSSNNAVHIFLTEEDIKILERSRGSLISLIDIARAKNTLEKIRKRLAHEVGVMLGMPILDFEGSTPINDMDLRYRAALNEFLFVDNKYCRIADLDLNLDTRDYAAGLAPLAQSEGDRLGRRAGKTAQNMVTWWQSLGAVIEVDARTTFEGIGGGVMQSNKPYIGAVDALVNVPAVEVPMRRLMSLSGALNILMIDGSSQYRSAFRVYKDGSIENIRTGKKFNIPSADEKTILGEDAGPAIEIAELLRSNGTVMIFAESDDDLITSLRKSERVRILLPSGKSYWAVPDRKSPGTIARIEGVSEISIDHDLQFVDSTQSGAIRAYMKKTALAAKTSLDVLRRRIADALERAAPGTLTAREKEVLVLRHGIGGGFPRTIEEVSRIFNTTRERIRGIEEKAIRKLGVAGTNAAAPAESPVAAAAQGAELADLAPHSVVNALIGMAIIESKKPGASKYVVYDRKNKVYWFGTIFGNGRTFLSVFNWLANRYVTRGVRTDNPKKALLIELLERAGFQGMTPNDIPNDMLAAFEESLKLQVEHFGRETGDAYIMGDYLNDPNIISHKSFELDIHDAIVRDLFFGKYYIYRRWASIPELMMIQFNIMVRDDLTITDRRVEVSPREGPNRTYEQTVQYAHELAQACFPVLGGVAVPGRPAGREFRTWLSNHFDDVVTDSPVAATTAAAPDASAAPAETAKSLQQIAVEGEGIEYAGTNSAGYTVVITKWHRAYVLNSTGEIILRNQNAVCGWAFSEDGKGIVTIDGGKVATITELQNPDARVSIRIDDNPWPIELVTFPSVGPMIVERNGDVKILNVETMAARPIKNIQHSALSEMIKAEETTREARRISIPTAAPAAATANVDKTIFAGTPDSSAVTALMEMLRPERVTGKPLDERALKAFLLDRKQYPVIAEAFTLCEGSIDKPDVEAESYDQYLEMLSNLGIAMEELPLAEQISIITYLMANVSSKAMRYAVEMGCINLPEGVVAQAAPSAVPSAPAASPNHLLRSGPGQAAPAAVEQGAKPTALSITAPTVTAASPVAAAEAVLLESILKDSFAGIDTSSTGYAEARAAYERGDIDRLRILLLSKDAAMVRNVCHIIANSGMGERIAVFVPDAVEKILNSTDREVSMACMGLLARAGVYSAAALGALERSITFGAVVDSYPLTTYACQDSAVISHAENVRSYIEGRLKAAADINPYTNSKLIGYLMTGDADMIKDACNVIRALRLDINKTLYAEGLYGIIADSEDHAVINAALGALESMGAYAAGAIPLLRNRIALPPIANDAQTIDRFESAIKTIQDATDRIGYPAPAVTAAAPAEGSRLTVPTPSAPAASASMFMPYGLVSHESVAGLEIEVEIRGQSHTFPYSREDIWGMIARYAARYGSARAAGEALSKNNDLFAVVNTPVTYFVSVALQKDGFAFSIHQNSGIINDSTLLAQGKVTSPVEAASAAAAAQGAKPTALSITAPAAAARSEKGGPANAEGDIADAAAKVPAAQRAVRPDDQNTAKETLERLLMASMSQGGLALKKFLKKSANYPAVAEFIEDNYARVDLSFVHGKDGFTSTGDPFYDKLLTLCAKSGISGLADKKKGALTAYLAEYLSREALVFVATEFSWLDFGKDKVAPDALLTEISRCFIDDATDYIKDMRDSLADIKRELKADNPSEDMLRDRAEHVVSMFRAYAGYVEYSRPAMQDALIFVVDRFSDELISSAMFISRESSAVDRGVTYKQHFEEVLNGRTHIDIASKAVESAAAVIDRFEQIINANLLDEFAAEAREKKKPCPVYSYIYDGRRIAEFDRLAEGTSLAATALSASSAPAAPAVTTEVPVDKGVQALNWIADMHAREGITTIAPEEEADPLLPGLDHPSYIALRAATETRSAENDIDREIRDMIALATETGREIPTYKDDQYVLIVNNNIATESEFALDKDSGYEVTFPGESTPRRICAGDRVKLIRADTSNVDNIRRNIPAGTDLKRVIIQIPANGVNNSEELDKLREAGARVMPVDTAGFGSDMMLTPQARKECRFEIYAGLLAGRRITADDVKANNGIYRTLCMLIDSHRRYDDKDLVVGDYIDALLNLRPKSLLYMIQHSLSYRRTGKWASPVWNLVAAALISA